MTPEMRALLTGIDALYLPIFVLAIVISANPSSLIGALVFTALVLLAKVTATSAYVTGFAVSIFLQIFVY